MSTVEPIKSKFLALPIQVQYQYLEPMDVIQVQTSDAVQSNGPTESTPIIGGSIYPYQLTSDRTSTQVTVHRQ